MLAGKVVDEFAPVHVVVAHRMVVNRLLDKFVALDERVDGGRCRVSATEETSSRWSLEKAGAATTIGPLPDGGADGINSRALVRCTMSQRSISSPVSVGNSAKGNRNSAPSSDRTSRVASLAAANSGATI